MKSGGNNVAFKVTWVYGKKGPFTSACTAAGRAINIQLEKKVWCNAPENACWKKYDAGNTAGPVGGSPCDDVHAFRDWAFGGGVRHSGPLKGKPIPIRRAKKGKLAFLTSKRAGMKESQRMVLGFFEISDVTDGRTWVDGHRGTRVPNASLGKAPKFWKFYRQSGPPRWGCGLFRYLNDKQAAKLRDAVMKAAGKV